jgi:hypothetical protein
MNKNIGAIDRAIRIAIAIILLYLGLLVYGDSILGIALAIVSIIPLVTAWLGNCPLYNLLGISTSKGHPNFHSK